MKTLVRTGIIVAFFWLNLSGICLAKLVYLSDGSELECQAFQKRHGQIVVKVNRDVIVEFAPSEVNMAKTFRPAPHKAHRMKHKNIAARDIASPAKAAAPEPTAPAVPAKTAQTATPKAIAPSAVDSAAGQQPVKEASPPPPPPAAEKEHPASEQAPLSKEEVGRRARENAEMMAQALKNHDQELLKKAVEAQKSLVEQQHKQSGQQQHDGGPRPEPPWFKYFLMMIASMLIVIVSMWVIFQRAGQSGWKSIIPLYNMYLLMVISGKPGWWFAVTFVPVVGAVFFLMAMMSLADKFGRSAVFGVGLAFLPMFFFPMMAFGGSKYESPHEEMNFTFSEPPQA